MVWNDFIRGYTEGVFHEESMLPPSCNQPLCIEHIFDLGSSTLQKNPTGEDDVRGLLRDALVLGAKNLGEFSRGQEIVVMPEKSTFIDPMHVERFQYSSNDETKN